MPSESVIVAERLHKTYELHRTPMQRVRRLLFGSGPGVDTFDALKDISFDIRRGEFLGIIGQNGSGKSTLLQIIAGILKPTSGNIRVTGRVAALLELGAGFHPEFSGRENVRFNGQLLGMNGPDIDRMMPEIEAFADIGAFIDEPVKTYSSGMFVRLAFAVQACLDPDILIVDEALAVGDVFFRLKCYERLNRLRDNGCTIVLVTHSMEDVLQYATQALLLDHGRALFLGNPDEAVTRYYASGRVNIGGAARAADAARPVPVAGGDPAPGASFVLPPDDAYFDASALPQVGDESVRCLGIAVCDGQGQPQRVFRQGDALHVYARFSVREPLETPCVGLVIRTDRGVIVHGRHSAQSDSPVPARVAAPAEVVAHYRVQLDIGIGEYLCNIGFATWPAEVYAARSRLSMAELEASAHRRCSVPDAFNFSVIARSASGFAVQPFYGLAGVDSVSELATLPARTTDGG